MATQSIAAKELFPIVLALVLFMTDNAAVVGIMNKTSSACAVIMTLFRNNRGAATICSHISTISFVHKVRHLTDPTNYLKNCRPSEGHLFQLGSGAPVTYKHFCSTLHSALKFNVLDTKQYKGHSFRIGAATRAASMGIPETVIRKLGRWKSDALKQYIRINVFSQIKIN
ncbi:uncharacterized protein LOC135468177 [Liolophura sinensis]|uniref:uncharacterized protein LOC135468177 n=1 Tax=Liolophura sinensis TaxID=3198878 RepID=UPI003158E1B0